MINNEIRYINDNYNFKPSIIHSDFEKAISNALEQCKDIFPNLIHSRCFFHFSKMIRSKLASEGLSKKKFNKLGLEFLRNIEMLCFIKLDKIEEFKKIILNKMNEYNGYAKFKNYIKKYLFKINPKIYNYGELIEYFKNINNDNFLYKFHSTNNICECINSKLSYYLPKENTSNLNFINSITKVINNDEFIIKDEIRHDYITKSFIYYIDQKDFNNNLQWINYSEFKESTSKLIHNNIKEIDDNKFNNIINFIDNLERSIKNNNETELNNSHNIEELEEIDNDKIKEQLVCDNMDIIYENKDIDNNDESEENNNNFEDENYICSIKDNEPNLDDLADITDKLTFKENKDKKDNEKNDKIDIEKKVNNKKDLVDCVKNKDINFSEPLLKRVENRIKKNNKYPKKNQSINKNLLDILKIMNIEIECPHKRKKDDLSDSELDKDDISENFGQKKKAKVK